jgi:hypothetical protein
MTLQTMEAQGSYRSRGKGSNVDESLFGNSSARTRRDLRNAGNSIVSIDPANSVVLDASSVDRMVVRYILSVKNSISHSNLRSCFHHH